MIGVQADKVNLARQKSIGRSERIASYRKSFLSGLILTIVLGVIFGVLASQFFFQFLNKDPDHPGYPLGTWLAMRETFIATMSVFGIVIWPAIFSGLYFLARRKSDAKLNAELAIYDEEARQARIEKTNQKIVEAQARGDLDRF